MKKILIVLITLFINQLTFGQTNDELLKMWNSEIVRIGDTEKKEFDSKIQDFNSYTKKLLSSHYSNGTLTVFLENESIRKLVKSYTRADTTFNENYYFGFRWPFYIEISHSKQKFPDKFYFDKTNLMLCIDSEKNEFSIQNEKCNEMWWNLLEAMDKLVIAAKSEEKLVYEDEIKLPEPPPMTLNDSLKMIELKKQIDELMKTVPDSIKK